MAKIQGQAPANATPANRDSNGFFLAGNKRVAFERFLPPGAGGTNKYPGVLLVHGADGLLMPDWVARYQRWATAFAQAGNVVYLPHYLQSTDTRRVTPPLMVRYFQPWMQTLIAALAFMEAQPEVAPQRIGVVGFSLGASLALALGAAGAGDDRISAIVDCFGSLPEPSARTLPRMPPTLILHGDADPIVSITEADKLEGLFRRRNIGYQRKTYPNEGHGFGGKAEIDAIETSIKFLSRVKVPRRERTEDL